MDEKINKELKKLTAELEKRNSFKHELLIGIVRGFGTIVGATVVVGIFIWILSLFTDFIPWLNIFIQKMKQG